VCGEVTPVLDAFSGSPAAVDDAKTTDGSRHQRELQMRPEALTLRIDVGDALVPTDRSSGTGEGRAGRHGGPSRAGHPGKGPGLRSHQGHEATPR